MELVRMMVDGITISVSVDEDGYEMVVSCDNNVPVIIRNGIRMVEVG
jgi:hypothetical protein